MNQITFVDTFQTTTAQGQFTIGQQGQTPDGNKWMYVKANGALAKGSVAVPDAITAVDNVSSSTDALGRIVYITKASAGWTVGAYANDYVVVDDGTGVGQMARISDNSTDTLTLYTNYALSTALSSADSDITIFKPYHVVKSAITSKLQNAQGIAQVAFTSGDYGWILYDGPGVVLAGEVLTPAGSNFVTGDDTTGQVVKGTTAKGPFDEQSLGRVLVVNAAADQLVSVEVKINS